MDIVENVVLGNLTTFRVGGKAKYLAVVKNEDDLKKALFFAREKKEPFFVMGGGSNILVSDSGFSGVVIKSEIAGFSSEEKEGDVFVTFGSGVPWDECVEKTVGLGLSGLENLSLIPGTVGASSVQNIGAYGVEAKDIIFSVKAIDAETGNVRVFSNAECRFGYRDSIFKRPDFKKYVVTSVTFRLSKEPKGNISYKDLREYFSVRNISNPSAREIREAVVLVRTAKFPDLSKIGTAGSFWKNPILSKEAFSAIQKKYPPIPSFPDAQGNIKVPLAWILDNVCKVKGLKIGRVGLFERQPLVLIAEKGATKKEVDVFAEDIASLVYERTGIHIEREVESVGV